MNPESLAWIIKNLEPRMRALGKTFSWEKVNAEILAGSDLSKLALPDSTPEETEALVAKFAQGLSPTLAGGEREQNDSEIASWQGESNANNRADDAHKPSSSHANQSKQHKIL